MTGDVLRERIFKNADQYFEGRGERVGGKFCDQPTQCVAPVGGIAMLKRGKHVIAKHGIAAVFEEVELSRHGVQVGLSVHYTQNRPGIIGRNKSAGMIAGVATGANGAVCCRRWRRPAHRLPKIRAARDRDLRASVAAP